MCLKCCQKIREDQGGVPTSFNAPGCSSGAGATGGAAAIDSQPRPSAPPKSKGDLEEGANGPCAMEMPPPPSYNEAVMQEDVV